jgi:hypothetical protein
VSGFRSLRSRPRSIIKQPARRTPAPDPYAPGSDGYAERHTTHVTDMGNGLVRVDLGEPLKRLPCETQPILKHIPKPVPATAPAEAPKAIPVSTPSATASARLRDHRAITRDA